MIDHYFVFKEMAGSHGHKFPFHLVLEIWPLIQQKFEELFQGLRRDQKSGGAKL